MAFYSSPDIYNFYTRIDVFLVAFARLAGFFALLPVFGGNTVPVQTRILFAVFVSILAVTTGIVQAPVYADNFFAFTGVITTEFLIGVTLGFFIFVLMAAFTFMGQLVDYQIGFSMVSVFDPVTQIQAPITGNLYYTIMLIFFIQTGTMHGFIYEITRSFDTVPVGSAGIIGNAFIADYAIKAITQMTISAVRISLPVVGTILVVDVVLGILVKAVPNMNVFVVGMPLKVLVGLVLLLTLAPFFGEVYSFMAEDILRFGANALNGMAP